ncbi:hypothetical protein JL721_1348 [Aureococcus anophagefferens]|nr:hypothetical protein JL721_1348 [Aureococcus anophagefferens]
MASSPAASSQRRSIPAVVHTRIDKARVRTLAQNIASTHLSALLGSGVALPKPPALPWVDLEVSPRFDRPVEICIDCPEKACGAPGVARVLVLLEPEEVSRAAARRLGGRPAEAAVATDGDYAAAIEANYERAQAFLDLEGRLEAAAARFAAPPATIGDCVWRPRTWPLRLLSEAQYAAWEADGYVCLPGSCRRRSARPRRGDPRVLRGRRGRGDLVREHGRHLRRVLAPRLAHGPCGMVQMSHHASLWAIRQCPGVHGAFADVYGTEELWVTCDRAHFKPPERADHPAWADPGDVHRGMHWDVDVGRPPVPFSVQGVVYLEATDASTGALRVVPGCRGRLASLREAWRSTGADAHAGEAVAAEGPAGTLVLWHGATHHGPGRNVGERPRVSAYVAMLPVDAAPFVGPRRPSYPLSLSDAGTPRTTPTRTPRRARPRRPRASGAAGRRLVEDPAEADLDRRPRARPTARRSRAHGARPEARGAQRDGGA